MLWIVILQSDKDYVNVWRYPQNRNYEVENIDWTYSPASNERIFGIAQYVKGSCPVKKAKEGQACNFSYSSIITLPNTAIKLYVKGKGTFVIGTQFVGVNYFIYSTGKKVDLSDEWQEVYLDLTKAVAIGEITPPIIRDKNEEFQTGIKIYFHPLTEDFEIYISKFIEVKLR